MDLITTGSAVITGATTTGAGAVTGSGSGVGADCAAAITCCCIGEIVPTGAVGIAESTAVGGAEDLCA